MTPLEGELTQKIHRRVEVIKTYSKVERTRRTQWKEDVTAAFKSTVFPLAGNKDLLEILDFGDVNEVPLFDIKEEGDKSYKTVKLCRSESELYIRAENITGSRIILKKLWPYQILIDVRYEGENQEKHTWNKDPRDLDAFFNKAIANALEPYLK